MAKKSNTQIRENIRNAVAATFRTKIEHLNETIKTLEDRNKELSSKNGSLKEENLQLKDKIQKMEDWIERMQDYCNMSEEERSNAMKREKINSQLNEEFSRILDFYESALPGISSFFG